VAENEIVVDAGRERVWQVLAEPATYAEWVVGASEVRDADAEWPQVGTRLHHSQGAGPLTIDDSTEVVESVPPERLVLLAHLGPVGSFRVELRLEDVDGAHTRIVMVEHPVEGVAKAAGPVGDAAGRIRNKLSLSRLKDLAER
jgi:uncharacterized protein YndB with AHSA1/START domain